jgi:2-keto-4-pentenoate hydratase/2-oxohepta-3-ene-1,7-dioic acid hydratase in catechol pathway
MPKAYILTKIKHSILRGPRCRLIFFLILACPLGSCSPIGEATFDETIEPSKIRTVAISDPNQALTFVRIELYGKRRVIAVHQYKDGIVQGIDLSVLLNREVDDPIQLFLAEGYDTLSTIIAGAASNSQIKVPSDKLIIPVDLKDHHIATGTNFRKHADETTIEHGPFLFPKLVKPTGPYDPVHAGDTLLDYEVEIAWVPLEPIVNGYTPKYMGLILCNDFTDRETLLGHIEAGNIESGKGFTTGKSFPNYLPVGNLFVIPRDFRAFVTKIKLRLYVNYALRQSSMVNEMTWDIDKIIAEIWARRSASWQHQDQMVSLLEEAESISDRVLIMSGTPQGTVFRGVGAGPRISGFFAWLLGGWRDSIATHAIEVYIDNARSAGIYLQPGDQVLIYVDFMGVIHNNVIR